MHTAASSDTEGDLGFLNIINHDSELVDKDIGQLLNLIELNYETEYFSQKFKDRSIEKEFLKFSYKQKMELALVTIVE